MTLATVPDLRRYEPVTGRREFVALQRSPGTGIVRRIRLVLGWRQEMATLVEAAQTR